MSDRSSLFDLRTSTSVALDQVLQRRDTVEIPAEAPLAMPVQHLAFWQGGARRATSVVSDMNLRRWIVGLATLFMGAAGKTFIKYKDVKIGQVIAVELSEDYERVLVKAKIAKHAHMNGLTLKQAGLALGLVDEATFDRLVRPQDMI